VSALMAAVADTLAEMNISLPGVAEG